MMRLKTQSPRRLWQQLSDVPAGARPATPNAPEISIHRRKRDGALVHRDKKTGLILRVEKPAI
jgi:hypothetical protein